MKKWMIGTGIVALLIATNFVTYNKGWEAGTDNSLCIAFATLTDENADDIQFCEDAITRKNNPFLWNMRRAYLALIGQTVPEEYIKVKSE